MVVERFKNVLPRGRIMDITCESSLDDFILSEKAVKQILKYAIYPDDTIPIPSKAQEASWMRGVEFGTIISYIEKAKEEKGLLNSEAKGLYHTTFKDYCKNHTKGRTHKTGFLGENVTICEAKRCYHNNQKPFDWEGENIPICSTDGLKS